MADVRAHLTQVARVPVEPADVDALWTRGRRRRRRRAAVRGVAAAGVLALVVAVGAAIATDPAAPVVGDPPHTVTTHRLTHPVSALAAADGRVWTIDYDRGTAVVVHPTDEATARVPPPTNRACDVVATADGPAVRTCQAGVDTLMLPAGEVVELYTDGPAAVAGNLVWQGATGALVARAPADGSEKARIAIPGAVLALDGDGADHVVAVVRDRDTGTRLVVVGADRRSRALTLDGVGNGVRLAVTDRDAWVLDIGAGRLLRAPLTGNALEVTAQRLTIDHRARLAAGPACVAVVGSEGLLVGDGTTLTRVPGVDAADVTGLAAVGGHVYLATGAPEVGSVPCR